ncbi:Hypothetical protein, putative [Bodo saltans]|uniref:WD40 repeat-containing protein n=1 Tax=Bodo saltans TaxID=75058 RepID=A0A0S4JR70_BODSA|nr:Hypothetical protein, putative [Bodo saltans]|eukprot:CUG94035.1 Hypothetical protein, putative [Bodo saltans]
MPKHTPDDPSRAWKSLFLPLGTTERVVFSSFYTPVSSSLNVVHVANDADTQRESLLCVMEDQTVSIFDLSNGDTGPAKVSSFTAAREMKVPLDGSEPVVATCAALIPIALAHVNQHQTNTVVTPTNADGGNEEAPDSILRGVVGSSNGRVDVFMGKTYAFGFPAHKCPVAHVQALYVGESATPTAHPDGKSIGGNVVPTSSTNSRQADSANRVGSSSTAQHDFLSSISSALGFVTMGVDGVVFIWRRRSDGFRREKLVEPSLLSKCHAIHAALPGRCEPIQVLTFDNDSCTNEPSERGSHTNPRDPLYSPSHTESSFGRDPNHPSSGGVKELMPRGYRLHPSLIFSGGNGFSNTIKVRSCETMKEVEEDISLDGVFTRTSAITVDGGICIVAREKVVYAIDYVQRTCKRIFTATSCVKHLTARMPLAVAGCESGKVYVVNASIGVVLGTCYTYSAAPVISLSFVYSALMIAVVDDTKCVEIFLLPESYLRHPAYKRVCTFDANVLASTDVLQKYVALQECSTGAGTAAVARSAVAEEQLLLARLVVPEEVTRYLRVHHRVL